MTSISSEQMVERYEELRNRVLANQTASQNLGLALFLGSGMAAWMKTWKKCTASREVSERKVSRDKMEVLSEVYEEIVMVLVSMALKVKREG